MTRQTKAVGGSICVKRAVDTAADRREDGDGKALGRYKKIPVGAYRVKDLVVGKGLSG